MTFRMAKIRINLRIERIMLRQLEQEAKEKGMTFSELIRVKLDSSSEFK